jgi:hypothetical protein
MLSIVPWWPLPEIGSQITSPRARWAVACVVGALGLCSQVVWLKWYFVIHPHSSTYP